MILFLIGPVGRAVLRILKEKIRAAEAKYKSTIQGLQAAHDIEVEALKRDLEVNITTELDATVSQLLKG